MVAGHAFTTVFSFVKLFVVCFFANNFYIAIPINCCAVNLIISTGSFQIEAGAKIVNAVNIGVHINDFLTHCKFSIHCKFEGFADREIFVLLIANLEFTN